jgi:pyroglutamyl-peptidase
MRTLITSFGPFGDFGLNPSNQVMDVLQALIEKGETPGQEYSFEKLNVSWEHVDAFISNTANDPFDLFIHLGVATGSDKMRIETKGRNSAEGKDVLDANPSFPTILAHTSDIVSILPMSELKEFVAKHPEVVLSDNAGSYLCNYIYFRSLHTNGLKSKVLFIHIADTINTPSAPKIELQADLVLQLIQIMQNQRHNKVGLTSQ